MIQIFQPIPKPAVNDFPLLVANRTKIEKVGLFIQKRKPPIILASLGCFFAHHAHLSYSLTTARLASSFFMPAMQTSSLFRACSLRPLTTPLSRSKAAVLCWRH